MKVVLVSKECPPSPRSYGIGTYVWETANGLARRGHCVTIVAAADDGVRSELVTPDGARVMRLPDAAGPLGLVQRTLSPGRDQALAYSDSVAACIDDLWREGLADLVEFPGFRGESYSWLQRRPRGLPMVTRFHGFTGWAGQTWRDFVSASRRLQKSWESRELQEADFVTVVAQHLVPSVARRIPRDRMAVVYNGIETAVWAERARLAESLASESDIVFVGSLTRTKGIHVLLRAAEFLRRRHRWSGRLLLAGRGSREFDSCVRNMWGDSRRLPSWLVRVGHCPREHLAAYYSQAGVCCFPSLQEPLGYTCMEAMASGGIVIGTAGTGMGEVVAEGAGYLVRPGSVEDLAERLGEALRESPAGRIAMRRRAVETVTRRFDIDVVLAEMETIYARVMECVAAEA